MGRATALMFADGAAGGADVESLWRRDQGGRGEAVRAGRALPQAPAPCRFVAGGSGQPPALGRSLHLPPAFASVAGFKVSRERFFL